MEEDAEEEFHKMLGGFTRLIFKKKRQIENRWGRGEGWVVRKSQAFPPPQIINSPSLYDFLGFLSQDKKIKIMFHVFEVVFLNFCLNSSKFHNLQRGSTEFSYFSEVIQSPRAYIEGENVYHYELTG